MLISRDEDDQNNNYVFQDSVGKGDHRAILYFKANTSQHSVLDIYNFNDNADIITDQNADGYIHAGGFIDDTGTAITVGGVSAWYDFIVDSKSEEMSNNAAYERPYNKDTFILVNAGPDGVYGTPDDITNFTRNN